MADLSTLPLDVRSTIAESLADMAESHWSGFEVLVATPGSDDTARTARELAEAYETLTEFFLHGRDLIGSDIDDITVALERSEEIAREVGEDDAAAEYERARILVLAS